MRVPKSLRTVLTSLAVVLTLAGPLVLAGSGADARVGGGFGSGSRGGRTFSAPPATSTAPSARPIERSITQPASPGLGGGMRGGFFNRPGLFGGLMAGFLGAGLFGMLFGGGLFGGLGGLSSLIGLVLQIALIVIVARLVMSWWRQRQTTAYATASSTAYADPTATTGRGFGFGLGSNSAPLKIEPDDYEAFERLLVAIQTAWSNEDLPTLQRLATSEMAGYFSRDLMANANRGVVNKVADVKLLQGDLSEAWREGDTDYATVAMRYSLVDKTLERGSGRVVEGHDQPDEVTEVWTFRRDRGSDWRLSAIQQV